MTIDARLMAVLEAVETGSRVAGHSMQNTKRPEIRQLEKAGLIVRGDATDGDKADYTLTAAGKVYFPEPTPEPQEEPQPMTTETVTDKPKRVRNPNATPRVKPMIGLTGVRIPLPEKAARAGGNRTERYPFSRLAEPNDTGHDSFFVASTPDMPNPAKQLASTVYTANRRLKDTGKVFVLHDMPHDHEHGVAGARVFRVK